MQLFFLNYAQIWCGSMRPEDAQSKILSRWPLLNQMNDHFNWFVHGQPFPPNILTLERIADWESTDKLRWLFAACTVLARSEWWAPSPTQESLRLPTTASQAPEWTLVTSAPSGEDNQNSLHQRQIISLVWWRHPKKNLHQHQNISSLAHFNRPFGPKTDLTPQVRGGWEV